MTNLGPGRAFLRVGALCLAAFVLLLVPSGAGARLFSPRYATIRWSFKRANGKVPHRLLVAAYAARRADSGLVAATWNIRRCRHTHPHHPGHCMRAHARLQQAGRRLRRAQSNLALVGASRATNDYRWGSLRRAPQLTVSRDEITWQKIASVGYYVLASKVPGQPTRYSLIHGEAVTPPPVAGATVHYSVRTAVWNSAWAPEVAISYPASPPPSGGGAPAPNPLEAPAISVEGQKLRWNKVANVNTYVMVTRMSGRADVYSEVEGTSITPPAAPGATVIYSVRTAVEGSAWAKEVSIRYAQPQPQPQPKKEETPSPGPGEESSRASAGPFEMGVNAGTSAYELQFIHTIGARTARLYFDIGSSISEMAPLVEAYARGGVKLLLDAGFSGRVPTPSEAQHLGTWAAAFGPGGSFWKSTSLPASLAVTDIEFGNETSYTYQYSDNSASSYASRAQTYALRFKEAQEAVHAADPNVGLLAQGDSGGVGPSWVANMFAAVPDLAKRAAGWTVHPYGPNWQVRMDELVNQTAAQGAPATIPIWVTEWGLSSDDGRCLSDNYGWNRCMTYAEAATTLTGTLAAMRARYGPRLTDFYLYHVRDHAPSGTSTNREEYFGALQSDNAAKGAYSTAVQALISANP